MVLCVLVVVGCGVFGLLFGLVVVFGMDCELVSLVACGCLWYDILVAVFWSYSLGLLWDCFVLLFLLVVLC